jgi:hypothetical protein
VPPAEEIVGTNPTTFMGRKVQVKVLPSENFVGMQGIDDALCMSGTTREYCDSPLLISQSGSTTTPPSAGGLAGRSESHGGGGTTTTS